jgi:ABC-type dipeptide/oligopeptide/nickel transport system permease subunit
LASYPILVDIPTPSRTRQQVIPTVRPTRDLRLWIGLGLLAIIIGVAVFAPSIAPYDPVKIDPSVRLIAPSADHLFGTDMYGRDLFSRMLYGAQPSLTVAVGAVLIGLVPGVMLGLIAGSRRGVVDQFLTQIMDAWIALPGVLVALVMVAMLGRSLLVLTLALAISTIPTFYRVTRAETLRASIMLYVKAAESLGATPQHILLRHILPNIASSLIVLAAVTISRMLLASSGLSFIGLGAPPPSPEWGSLLAESRSHLHDSGWLIWFPGMAIFLATFAFYSIGTTLRDRL